MIQIEIKDKIAKIVTNQTVIANNNDYQIKFIFDTEWEAYSVKTVRFAWSDGYIDVVINGDAVNIPVIPQGDIVAVGVYAGDIKTSTPAWISVSKSILDGEPAQADLPEDKYNQIIEMINAGVIKGDKGDKGDKGEKGEQGIQGDKGEKGEKGDKGDTGLRGPQGDQGPQGEKGQDGYTPVKGKDYWTDSDKTEINTYIAEELKKTEQALESSALLGEELVNANNWSLGAGWSGSFSTGFTHASGNTAPLTFTPTIVAGKLYQVTFKSSIRMTTSNLFVQVGNSTQFNLYGEDTTNDIGNVSIGVLAVDTSGLVFTPESSFTGTLTEISIKEIIGNYEAVQQYFDTNGAVSFEIHATPRGLENVFIGQATGEMNTTGHENVGVGVNALAKNTSGFWNIGIGKDCLKNNTGGSRNLALGYNALRDNEVGQRNIALGTFAMTQMKNGNWNIAIGADSMNTATGGNKNTAIGFNTLTHNGGDNNVALGADILSLNTSGSMNIGIGQGALAKNTTGNANVCIGYNSGTANTTASGNIGVGWASLYKTTTGEKNVAIGYGSGKSLTTGKRNILIGSEVEADTATTNYQLNIGNLLKGYLGSDGRYLSVNGGLRLPNIATSEKGNDEVYAEEWTFTLEDGSTVTKKVLMK